MYSNILKFKSLSKKNRSPQVLFESSIFREQQYQLILDYINYNTFIQVGNFEVQGALAALDTITYIIKLLCTCNGKVQQKNCIIIFLCLQVPMYNIISILNNILISYNNIITIPVKTATAQQANIIIYYYRSTRKSLGGVPLILRCHMAFQLQWSWPTCRMANGRCSVININ